MQNQTREGEACLAPTKLKIIMKKLVFFITLSSVLLYSCSNRDVQRIAQQFLQLYYIDHDFNAAAELVTETSLDGLRHTALMFEFDPSSRVDMFETFKIISMDVQKSRAICHYEVDDVKRRLLLSHVDGRWLVDMPGSVMQGGLDFSLTLTPASSGGFASAESELTRIGDVPERKR